MEALGASIISADQVGHDHCIRKAYYSDNREDAVIMTTSPIDTPEYETLFTTLQTTYQTRWGRMLIEEY